MASEDAKSGQADFSVLQAAIARALAKERQERLRAAQSGGGPAGPPDLSALESALDRALAEESRVVVETRAPIREEPPAQPPIPTRPDPEALRRAAIPETQPFVASRDFIERLRQEERDRQARGIPKVPPPEPAPELSRPRMEERRPEPAPPMAREALPPLPVEPAIEPAVAPATDRFATPQAPAPVIPPDAGTEPSLGDAARALGSAVRRAGARQVQAIGSGMAALGSGVRRVATPGRPRPARPEPAPAPAPPPRPAKRARPAPPPGATVIRRGWRLFVTSVLFAGIGAAGALIAVWMALQAVPLADVLPPAEEPSLLVETVDGEVLTSQGAYQAPFVPLSGIPQHLAEAVVAIEDQRFLDHGGVDWRGVARALVRNVQAGGVVEGGSGITQQLVKILYLGPERTMSRKVQEAVLATLLDRQLGKERILELYLNSVYLGSGAHGMPAAARTYFNKGVDELTLPESALLAASIQLPSEVNPLTDLGATQNRAALVLTLMEDQGRIDEATRDEALAQLAVLAPEPPPGRAGGYFADWVLEEVEALRGAASGGVQATATLDPALQADAERAIREVVAERGAAAGATQAALVAMTPNGRVRAMVGGLDYRESQFNRATDALRQPGSTFKLFVYMAALLQGATPEDTVEDLPIEIDGWEPENFDGLSHGTVTLAEAFARSYNLAAVRLAQEVGIDNVIEVARRFGIESQLEPTPSLALGTSEVTLLDMTEAYAGLSLGRVPVRATGIETLSFGDEEQPLGVTGVNERDLTQLTRTREPMIEMLRGVLREGGTGQAARVPRLNIAGKTGTSQNNRDAWFIGFVNDRGIVVGVWVGNDDNSPMDDRTTGGSLPAEIFQRFVSLAKERRDAERAAETP